MARVVDRVAVSRALAMIVALVMMVAGFSAYAQSQPTFPPLSGRVVDAAKLLSPEQAAQLTQLSDQIEQASSRQLVVATVPDLQGYPIEDYGYRLGRAWQIGQKDANNGIILLVAPNERKVRIEVGYGLEPIMTDALSSVIINQTILPRFRAGDMAGGIVAGAQAIGEQMKLPLEAAEQRAKKEVGTAQTRKRSGYSGSDIATAIFWVIVILFFVIPMIRRMSGGKRYRGGVAPVVLWGPGFGGGGGWGGGGGGGGFGGFSGGGGSFGGGGASGDW